MRWRAARAVALVEPRLVVAVPTWKTMAQREKEEELIWPATATDPAIRYERRTPHRGAPKHGQARGRAISSEKYQDPVTNGEFEFVGVSQAWPAPGVRTTRARVRPGWSASQRERGEVPRGRLNRTVQRVEVRLRAMKTPGTHCAGAQTPAESLAGPRRRKRPGGSRTGSAPRGTAALPSVRRQDTDVEQSLRRAIPIERRRRRGGRAIRASAFTTASWTSGRSASSRSAGRTGWTRLVSSTTYRSRTGRSTATCPVKPGARTRSGRGACRTRRSGRGVPREGPRAARHVARAEESFQEPGAPNRVGRPSVSRTSRATAPTAGADRKGRRVPPTPPSAAAFSSCTSPTRSRPRHVASSSWARSLRATSVRRLGTAAPCRPAAPRTARPAAARRARRRRTQQQKAKVAVDRLRARPVSAATRRSRRRTDRAAVSLVEAHHAASPAQCSSGSATVTSRRSWPRHAGSSVRTGIDSSTSRFASRCITGERSR